MTNQFMQKLNDLTETFNRMPSSPYVKEWREGEFRWFVRKRLLDDDFVEYYVSRVSMTQPHLRDRAFVYVGDEDGEWDIEVIT
jgi:hypothetical protein